MVKRGVQFGGGEQLGGKNLGSESSSFLPVEFDQLEDAIKSLNKELMRENRHLQDLTTQLQEKHHKISLEVGCVVRRHPWPPWGHEWLCGLSYLPLSPDLCSTQSCRTR